MKKGKLTYLEKAARRCPTVVRLSVKQWARRRRRQEIYEKILHESNIDIIEVKQ